MSRILSIGDRDDGPEGPVHNWQQYLVSQGFKLNPDGKFGPATLAATRKMQKRMGVRADGKVGHRTMDKTATPPIPQARPAMPPAPAPQAPVLASAQTGNAAPDPFVSSGPEADLNSMHAAASNRRADAAMAQELQGQYYDARRADLANQGAPPNWSPAFTDQGTAPPTHALDPAITAARGANPGASAAWAQGGPGASIDLSGVGGAPAGAGSSAGILSDPIKRDALIRMLLQQAGG